MRNVFLVTALCGASALAGVQYAKPKAAPTPKLTPVVKQSLTAAPAAACLTKGCTCGENCGCSSQGECLNQNVNQTDAKPETVAEDKQITAPQLASHSETWTVSPSPAASVSPTAGGVSYTAMPAPSPGYRWDCSTGVCRQVPIQYAQPVYYRTVPVYRRGRQVGWQRVYSRTYYQACRPGG